LLERY